MGGEDGGQKNETNDGREGGLSKKDGDRSSSRYHDKWQKFTDEEVHKIQLEEETLKKEMEKLTVATAMEEKTKRIQNEKKEMLREAKKRWEESEGEEMSRRVVIEKETEVTRAISEEELEQNSKSLHFREVTKLS